MYLIYVSDPQQQNKQINKKCIKRVHAKNCDSCALAND